MFGKVGVGRHNFRSLQRLSHHVVYRPIDTRIHTPQIIKVFDDIFKMLSEFVRNINT
jgi:hypothetical protein